MQRENDVELVDSTTQTISSSDKSNRKTTPYLTKYERARVLGTRALQLRYLSSQPFFSFFSLNAPPMVTVDGETDPLAIAYEELKQKKVYFSLWSRFDRFL